MAKRVHSRVTKWPGRRGYLREDGDTSNAAPDLSVAKSLAVAGMQRGTMVTVRVGDDAPDGPAPPAPLPSRHRRGDLRALQPSRERPYRRRRSSRARAPLPIPHAPRLLALTAARPARRQCLLPREEGEPPPGDAPGDVTRRVSWTPCGPRPTAALSALAVSRSRCPAMHGAGASCRDLPEARHGHGSEVDARHAPPSYAVLALGLVPLARPPLSSAKHGRSFAATELRPSRPRHAPPSSSLTQPGLAELARPSVLSVAHWDRLLGG